MGGSICTGPAVAQDNTIRTLDNNNEEATVIPQGRFADNYGNIFDIKDRTVVGLDGFESIIIDHDTIVLTQNRKGRKTFYGKPLKNRIQWEDGDVWFRLFPIPNGVYNDQFKNKFDVSKDRIVGLPGFEDIEFVYEPNVPNGVLLTQNGNTYGGIYDLTTITWEDGDVWVKEIIHDGKWLDAFGNEYVISGTTIERMDGFKKLEIDGNKLLVTQYDETVAGTSDGNIINWDDGDMWERNLMDSSTDMDDSRQARKTASQPTRTLSANFNSVSEKTAMENEVVQAQEKAGGQQAQEQGGAGEQMKFCATAPEKNFPGPFGEFSDQFGNRFTFTEDGLTGMDGFEKMEIVAVDQLVLTQNGNRYGGNFNQDTVFWEDGDIWEKMAPLPQGLYVDNEGNEFVITDSTVLGLENVKGIVCTTSGMIYLKQHNEIFEGDLRRVDFEGGLQITWSDNDLWTRRKERDVQFSDQDEFMQIQEQEYSEASPCPFECRVSPDRSLLTHAFNGDMEPLSRQGLEQLRGQTAVAMDSNDAENLYFIMTHDDLDFWAPKPACIPLVSANHGGAEVTDNMLNQTESFDFDSTTQNAEVLSDDPTCLNTQANYRDDLSGDFSDVRSRSRVESNATPVQRQRGGLSPNLNTPEKSRSPHKGSGNYKSPYAPHRRPAHRPLSPYLSNTPTNSPNILANDNQNQESFNQADPTASMRQGQATAAETSASMPPRLHIHQENDSLQPPPSRAQTTSPVYRTHPLSYDPSNVSMNPPRSAPTPPGSLLARRKKRQEKVSLRNVKNRAKGLSQQMRRYEQVALPKKKTQSRPQPRKRAKSPEKFDGNLFQRRKQQKDKRTLNLSGLRKNIDGRADLRIDYAKNKPIKKVLWQVTSDMSKLIAECLTVGIQTSSVSLLLGAKVEVIKMSGSVAEISHNGKTASIPRACLSKI